AHQAGLGHADRAVLRHGGEQALHQQSLLHRREAAQRLERVARGIERERGGRRHVLGNLQHGRAGADRGLQRHIARAPAYATSASTVAASARSSLMRLLSTGFGRSLSWLRTRASTTNSCSETRRSALITASMAARISSFAPGCRRLTAASARSITGRW